MQSLDILLQEAVEIGNNIVEQAHYDNADGIYWLYRSHEEKIDKQISIYSGNAGTILFLIELYKKTKDKKYLECIEKALQWLIQFDYREAEKNLGFYCGIGGVVFVLIEAYNLTNDSKYIRAASNFARTYNLPHSNSDILYGSASSIITLLHLHNVIQEDWITDAIFGKINALLNAAIITENGICWDRNGSCIHALCGFAHGASGIGFVFLELFRYFNNELFYQIAKMAFEYEDQYFSESGPPFSSKNNWPDLRKDIYTEDGLNKLINSYLTGQYTTFSEISYMSAWCHGAPGIGMARLHAFNLTKDRKHLDYLNKALDNTMSNLMLKAQNYTLCHGDLGNASLLLDTFLLDNNDQYYSIALEQAIKAINEKNSKGYWVSGISKIGSAASCDLLNGTAGIGHFFLRLIDPPNIMSVLCPKIKVLRSASNSAKAFDDAFLYNFIFRKTFPNTSLYFQNPSKEINLKNFSRNEILKCTEEITKNADNALKNSFAIDVEILNMSQGIQSDNFYFIKNHLEMQELNKQEIESLTLKILLKYKLELNPAIKLMKHIYEKFDTFTLLIVSAVDDPVNQFIIGEFTYDLLKSFEHQHSVQKSFECLKKNNEILVKRQFDDFYGIQIKNCLRWGFLTFRHDNQNN